MAPSLTPPAASEGNTSLTAPQIRPTDTMKTRDLCTDAGTLTGFEVSNGLLSRRRACRIAGGIQGAVVDRCPRRFSWLREDDFCLFSVDGVPFLIREPFGDNDCYWIVAVNPDSASRPLIERIRRSFAAVWR